MLTGRLALLEYDVPGPVVIHERLILEHLRDDMYVVATPDRDVFVEQLSADNQDLRSFRLRPQANMLPPGVQAGQVYALPAWAPDEMTAIRQEARQVAQVERAAMGVGQAVAPPVAAVAGARVVAPAREDSSRAPGAANLAPGVLTWVAAEGIDGYKFGDSVEGVTAPLALGAKTVHTLGDGRSLFCICINDATAEEFNCRAVQCDGRLARRKINALGTPEISIAEVVSGSKEFDMLWKIQGPRTAQWCLNYLAIEGLGLEGHHERFRQLCKLDSAAWGVQEHFQLSMMLRQLLQVDCFNGCNSLGIELMFRRLQTIEYAHSEKAREAESRVAGGRLALEEQYVFGSVVRHAGTLMIAPSLLSHVKEETEKEVLLAKNLRKAKEERELAAKKGDGNKKKQEENP